MATTALLQNALNAAGNRIAAQGHATPADAVAWYRKAVGPGQPVWAYRVGNGGWNVAMVDGPLGQRLLAANGNLPGHTALLCLTA